MSFKPEINGIVSMNDAPKEFLPNYYLDNTQLDRLEAEMADYAERKNGSGVHALLIEPTHPYSDFVRTHEERTFNGASGELSLQEELDTKQLVLVDSRQKSRTYGRVAFAGTLSGFRSPSDTRTETTGIVTIDELIKIPENNFTADDFKAYCKEREIDPNNVVGFETSIKLIQGMTPYHGFRTAQLAYLSLYKIGRDRKRAVSRPDAAYAALARANPSTITSTGRISIKHELLAGRNDWITPESNEKEKYVPVMYVNRSNRRFTVLSYLGPKILRVGT